MEGARVTDPSQRRLVGVLVMVGIALLQLASEYLGTRDAARFLSKAVTFAVGLPLLIVWAAAIQRWAARRRFEAVGPLFVGAIAAGLLFAGLLFATRTASARIALLQPHYGPWGAADVVRVGFAMGVTSFAIWALAFVFPFAVEDARVRALEAEKLRSQAELAELRSQLEPHFLLNTLNAIAGLVGEDPDKAVRLIGALGDLLRDAVSPGAEMETLDDQVGWLRRYAGILEARHDGHLAFNWQIAGATRRALLPRLLLQPLVENAVKHGALMRAGGGAITVRSDVADGGKLVCTVEDNGPGMAGATRPGAFGLVSVRRRLSLRYAGAAALRLESSPAGTRAVVELPLEETRT